MSKYVKVKVGERSVKLSNLDKVLYPSLGISKAEIIQYYVSVLPRMLPFIFNRPLSQVRWPDGIHKQKFYQKNKPNWAPDFVTSVLMGRETQVDYMLADENADVIWLANLACLEIHNCNTRVPEIKKPNYFVFDIDPPADAGFESVKKSSFLIRDFLESLGYKTFVKTSGGKGVHILCPIFPRWTIDEVVETCKLIARQFISLHPDHTLRVSKTVRKDKTLLDIYRNHASQTVVSPYSLRGKVGAPVSCPLTWEELGKLESPMDLNLRNVPQRFASIEDPWKNFDEAAVELHNHKVKAATPAAAVSETVAVEENVVVPPVLKEYKKKRDFKSTSEPPASGGGSASGKAFVVQRHHATNLHYDLRLEDNGVLLSWAIPKGMPNRKGVKRLAIETEPHPFKYIDFEGVIPEDEYGGGVMWVFATGEYEASEKTKKKIKFTIKGPEMNGSFAMYRTRDKQWIIERKDEGSKSVFEMDYRPMLADQSKTLIEGEDLSYEIKWDGIRTLIFIEDDEIQIRSKSGRLLNDKFPELVGSIEKLRVQNGVFDGEIVCLDEKGRPVFSDVISRMHSKSESKIKGLSKSKPAFCYLFDVLYLDGRDVCKEPLWRRQEWVEDCIRKGGHFRMSQGIAQGKALMEQMTALEMEGIMIKDKNGPYKSGDRTSFWRKLKVRTLEDCYIIGYTPGKGDRANLFGSLHLQLAADETIYRGKVGTGFDQTKILELKNLIDALPEAKRHANAENNPENRQSKWVEPSLRVEVQYASLTDNQTYREPVFKRLILPE